VLEYRAGEIALTLQIEMDGNVSITGYLQEKAPVTVDALLKVEMSTEEAARLRDLLVWALADLPGTTPPPGSAQ
jgi:hypothetical protein